jgi:hypothetical protein
MGNIPFAAKPWNLPLVPLWAYECLTRLAGTYPERFVLQMSMILGRPQVKWQDGVARHWAGLDSYRTPASICDQTAIWLWKCIEKRQPRLIIEFGTGFSTLVMAAYVQHRIINAGQRMTILSIEHDEKSFESQRSVLATLRVSNQVCLVHCPLEERTYFGQKVLCYGRVEEAMGQLAFGTRADLVFVDGPVGLLYGGAGRRGSILQSIALAREGGTILVHDALRSEEFGCTQGFHHTKSLHFFCSGIVPLWYGLAVCEKKCRQQ